MAKLQDKFFNRVIEGDLELGENENSQVVKAVEDTSALKVFENIVDKDGHKRFIEGEGIPETITGLSVLYNKWSLSGSHLMFVFAFKLDASSAVGGGSTFIRYTLPQWIMDKIAVLFGSYSVDNQKFDYFDNNGTPYDARIQLRKQDGQIKIATTGAIGQNVETRGRFEFDLLIDNAEPETQGE